MLQGRVTFPGITEIIEASISFVHGISPSIATLTIKPQRNFVPKVGPLIFYFGPRNIVIFANCTVDYASLQRNDRGEVWRLSLFDRRWRWKFGKIAGSYNIREEDEKTIKTGTEKTPHELVKLCFEAIGESCYDMADLPNESRPQIAWDGVLPMEAVAQLCDSLGCRVVLGIDNKVRIEKLGEGEALPLDGILERSFGYDSPELADEIAVLCGRNRYQFDFELEAVGEDTDGEIRLLDDLTYGVKIVAWDYEDFIDVGEQYGVASQKLARKTVFRWYRIKVPVWVPGFGQVDNLEHLHIEGEQVATEFVCGVKRTLPAWAYGVWFGEQDDGYIENSATEISPPSSVQDPQVIDHPFSIDAKQGLVKFSRPITASGSTDHWETVVPTLRLRTACRIRDKTTWAWKRFVVPETDKPIVQYLRHDEIVLASYPTLSPTFSTLKLNDNKAEVTAEAQHYLDGAWPLLQTVQPETITYMGLRTDIGLDGAIQHIIYSVGPRGATTTVSRNTEILHRVLPYKERRRIEKQGEIEEKTRML